jgi:hypothetical protein
VIRSPRIKPYPASKLKALESEGYDAALATIGYEERGRQIPEALGVAGLAVPFADHHEHDFKKNLEFFRDAKWEISECNGQSFYELVSAWFSGLLKDSEQLVRIAVDVSSMRRHRIADIVEAVFALPVEANIDVDFLYAPARYAEPNPNREPQVISVAPVTDAFAGWWDDLDKPLLAIVGLGYEFERAASALDVLEPDNTQIYVPKGSDGRYAKAVGKANAGLGELPGVMPSRVEYSVADPFSCFKSLEVTVSRMAASDRIALIPLGPKIFALAATVVAALHAADVQVVRVSAGINEPAEPRKADGNVYGLTISLRPPPEVEEIDENA